MGNLTLEIGCLQSIKQVFSYYFSLFYLVIHDVLNTFRCFGSAATLKSLLSEIQLIFEGLFHCS